METTQQSSGATKDMYCGVCLFKLPKGVQSLEYFRNTNSLRDIWMQEELDRHPSVPKLSGSGTKFSSSRNTIEVNPSSAT